MIRATELAHLVIRQAVQPGDLVIDATVGNGHDTLLLAELVGPSGRVIGFDIQETALEAARERTSGYRQVTLVHAGHENLAHHLTVPGDAERGLTAVMFNLGYLPGAPKDIVTCADTTLAALEQAVDLVAVRGLVTLVLYPGHPGGEEEATAVREYVARLGDGFAVTQYARINSARPAPELLVIERLA